LPQAVTRILNYLLDLPRLPARRGITKVGFEQVVAYHRLKTAIDGTLLAAPDFIDSEPRERISFVY